MSTKQYSTETVALGVVFAAVHPESELKFTPSFHELFEESVAFTVHVRLQKAPSARGLPVHYFVDAGDASIM